MGASWTRRRHWPGRNRCSPAQGRPNEPHAAGVGSRRAAAAGPDVASLRAAAHRRPGPASHSAYLRASGTTKRSAVLRASGTTSREGGKEMSGTALRGKPAGPAPSAGTGNGGVPASRAVTRWALRMFRREWRQQLLVLALITIAVAATIIGAAVATNTPPPAVAGFGTARDMATFQAPDPHLASQIAALRQRFGRVDVIENQTVAIPGSINTYQVRAQNPHGPYGQPMLSLVSGHFPAGPGQVAVTSGLAADLGLRIGSVWHQGGDARRVVGIVQNPQSLLDEFALVAPGQVRNPTQVTVLFDGHGRPPAVLAHNITPAGLQAPNVVNPDTISTAGLVVGMLLIALVAVGGFTVLAQRRLRSLGMLASTGATDRH